MLFSVMRAKIVSPISDPLITASSAYSALMAVGQKLVFPGVCASVGGSGAIVGFTINDISQVKAALKLFLFDRDFTAVADKVAYTVSDADSQHYLGTLATSTYEDVAAVNSHYHSDITPLMYRSFNNRKLYGQLMCTGTPTFTTVGDLTVKLHIVWFN